MRQATIRQVALMLIAGSVAALGLPKGITATIPADSKGTVLVLNGTDKELIGQTAAKIRGFRPPEPYGGKGVRYQGEKVREKAGKAAKAGGK